LNRMRRSEDCPHGHSLRVFGRKRKSGQIYCGECDRIRRSKKYHRDNPTAKFYQPGLQDLVVEQIAIETEQKPFRPPIMEEWPLTLCREVWPI
jgi:hypothetical protein